MAYAPYFACIAYILRQKMAYVDFGQNLSGGGSLNSTFCQIYSPVFRKNIFANLDSQNYFCSTLTKTKASEISSGPVPDGVIF